MTISLNQDQFEIPEMSTARSVSIAGPMTTKCRDEMLGAIKALMQQSSDPITLYIGNSNGGSLDAFYQMHHIFGVKAGGCNQRGPLITIVRGRAGSVTAFLGVLGHPAYMERSSQLTFHGARCADYQKGMILTREAAVAVSVRLDAENRRIAKKLAEAMVQRLGRRFVALQVTPRGYLLRGGNLPTPDLVRFARQVGKKLVSKQCRKVVRDALKRMEMIGEVGENSCLISQGGVKNDVKNCKDFLIRRLDKHAASHWPINELTVTEIVLEYFSMQKAASASGLAVMEELLGQFKQDALTLYKLNSHLSLIRKNEHLTEKYFAKNMMPIFLKLWNYAVALCTCLLTGQTTVGAEDAWQLGLIDGIFEPGCRPLPVMAETVESALPPLLSS